MDCLDPPLLEIPTGNWYCDDCFESSDESEDDVEEVEDLQNDIRTRQLQPQILRTSANERIRNAVLARMTLRSTREALGEGPTIRAPTRVVKKRRATRKRKTKRRARTTVVEYDVDGSDKFAMRTRRLVKKSRKKRKLKAKPAKRRAAKAPVASSTGFKNTNHNVHDLQRGRMLAGLSNFRIFQPTNQLDYVPDEEENIEDSGIDDGAENSRGNVLTQAIIGLRNPQRRNMIIKNRVLQNCTTTSSAGNLLDSIMQDQSMFASGSIRNKFSVEKSSGKLLFLGDHEQHAKQSAGGENSDSGGEPKTENTTSDNPNTSTSENQLTPSSDPVESAGNQAEMSRSSDNRDEPIEAAGESFENTNEAPEEKKKKASKKPAIDMFDENSNPETTDSCPNFSIYDPVDGEVPAEEETSNVFQPRLRVYDEENVDLVQMSDNENQESSGEAPLAIVASQPASPDLENDKICELIPERSYTPPIAQKVTDDAPEKDDSDKKRKKEKESKRSRKRELERYNVRDRLKDRSPVKLKDKFGRNRSRSRSSPRRKHSKRRSRSASRDRVRKSRSYDRYRRSRSYSRSSRRRTPSNEYDRRKKLQKEKSSKTSRRSRARSFAPRQHRPTTPDRRARSRSKKLKKKKHRDHSKEKPSTLTKEVFTSGQNILVSVNFNNQEEKSATKRSKSQEPKEIVDITARKKINVSSKPVAIIDLARSPFRELTPEYQSNVIELSDSDGEKASEKHQAKSPDSTLSSKLYDPFDILNSPSNENVTSSQNAAVQKLPEKPQEPVKNVMHYNKNVMAMASNSGLFFNEENLVTSSSSMATNEKQLPLLFTPMKGDAVANEKNASKNETVPMDLAESPYSPHEYDDSFAPHEENTAKSPRTKQSKGGNKAENIFDVLFGTSTPPGLDRVKSSNKKGENDGFKIM